jgi:hypothetical protein
MVIPALVGSLSAQTLPPSLAEDPLAGPEELLPWARKVTFHASSTKTKIQAILTATFRPVEENGLGMVYDNSHTRTVKEVWADKRANCMGLTAFLVATCKMVGINARFAEPANLNHWRREGQLIRIERHVVALIPCPPADDLVADFMPQLRQRKGIYVVDVLPEARVRALFHSNRAVEFMSAAIWPPPRNRCGSPQTDPLPPRLERQGVVQRALNWTLWLRPLTAGHAGRRMAPHRQPGAADAGSGQRRTRPSSLLSWKPEERPYFNAFLADGFAETGPRAVGL